MATAPEEVDVLHPLATLEWGRVGDLELPRDVRNEAMYFQCVALPDDRLCVYYHEIMKDIHSRSREVKDPVLCVSSPDLTSWEALTIKHIFECALATYRSRPILIGGYEEITTHLPTGLTKDLRLVAVTGKLWNIDLDHMSLQPSRLPSMPTPRRRASVTNAGSPECLIVAGGVQQSGEVDVVEVLIEEHWCPVQHLPKPCVIMSSTVHEGKLFLDARNTDDSGLSRSSLYHCDVNALIGSTSDKSKLTQWSVIDPLPVPSRDFLVTFKQQLLSVGSLSCAYGFPTQSWIPIGTHSVDQAFLYALTCPSRNLLAVMRQDKFPVASFCKASTRVSPYNPDSVLTRDSLFRLEALGIQILSTLGENITQLQEAIGISLKQDELEAYSTMECVKILIDRWLDSDKSPTWKVLENLLERQIGLSDLSRQIFEYLEGTESILLNSYHQILATQATVQMWFVKIILIGAPRLGKTTLRRRLTGEIDDIDSSGEKSEAPSTGTADLAHSVVVRNLSSTAAVITSSAWRAIKDLDDEAHLFLECFHGRMYAAKFPLGPRDITKVTISTVESKSDPEPKEQVNREARPAVSKALLVTTTDSESTSEITVSSPAPISVAAESSDSNTSLPPKSKDESSSQENDESRFLENVIRNANTKRWRDITKFYRDTAFIKMGDTGGQPEFMDMQSALTIGPALYLLFTKLTDDLQSPYKITYLDPKSGKSTSPRESVYTMEEILFANLASVACAKSTSFPIDSSTTDHQKLITSCKKSIAYIIGTHKDQLDKDKQKEQIAAFDKQLKDCIEPTAFYKKDIVQKSKGDMRMVIAVDNMHGGSHEVKKIRKLLEEGLKDHFDQLSIPASWLVLSLCLRKKQERTATLRSVFDLAGKLGMTESDTKLALWFLHHYAGVLMYFPNLEELADTVICDNQVVYDSTTNLIVNTFRCEHGWVPREGESAPYGSKSEHCVVGSYASEQFSRKGLFSLEDIRKALSTVPGVGDLLPIKKLVKLLEHLNILASFFQTTNTSALCASNTTPGKEMHFMPCVLQNATHDEINKWFDGISKQLPPAPLFIHFDCGFVPIGIFPAMIANLAGSNVQLLWEGIKKNRVQFRFGKDFDTVTLVSQPKYYAVHITRLRSAVTPMHEVCAKVRQLVVSTLKTVTRKMNFGFNPNYDLAFECPSHPKREHLCVVDREDASPRIMCCLENVHLPHPMKMSKQHQVWFTEVPSTCGLQLHEVVPYLEQLNTEKLYDLGVKLGLNFTKLKRIPTEQLPPGLCERWLREDDDVHQKSGTPTWKSLVRALRAIGANGVANSIEQEKLK